MKFTAYYVPFKSPIMNDREENLVRFSCFQVIQSPCTFYLEYFIFYNKYFYFNLRNNLTEPLVIVWYLTISNKMKYFNHHCLFVSEPLLRIPVWKHLLFSTARLPRPFRNILKIPSISLRSACKLVLQVTLCSLPDKRTHSGHNFSFANLSFNTRSLKVYV